MSRLGRLPTFLNAAVTAQVERDQIFTRVLRVSRSDNEVSGGRAGFEPALGYYPKHAFQACDLNRSSTSP